MQIFWPQETIESRRRPDEEVTMLSRSLRFGSVAVISLLAMAWVLNFFGQFGIGLRSGNHDYLVKFCCGEFDVEQSERNMRVQGLFWFSYHHPSRVLAEIKKGTAGCTSLSARLTLRTVPGVPEYWDVAVPILLIILLLLPFAVGTFTGFRFRLWQFFAYTALLGVQLVYLTRWR